VYVQLHTRLEGLRSLRHNEVQVALVDAEHDYESVKRDIKGLLRFLGGGLRFLVFDDYATDEGVQLAVNEMVGEGRLAIAGGVGYRPPWNYHGTVIHHWEGVVCEVKGNSSVAASQETMATMFKPQPGRVYAWYEESLWYPDDSLDFRLNGLAATSRGPGRWRADAHEVRALWLEWPAQRPTRLGGPAGAAKPKEQTWFLQFDADYDTFAAASFGNVSSKSATGLAHEVLQTMTRRLFVRVNHEFCNTANECEVREAKSGG